MGAKRQYTAIFAIGAKLLGSFRGAMAQAQSRLRALQATANRVGGGIKKLTVAFSGLFAVFGSFLAGKVLGEIFHGATDEAKAAEQRTRQLLVYLMQMDQIRRKGPAEAQKQLEILYEHNKALEAQGVLHHSILDAMDVSLIRSHIPVKDAQKTVNKLADVLVVTKGINASLEQGTALSDAFAKAVTLGNLRSLSGAGVRITKEQRTEFNKAANSVERYAALMKIFGDNYGDANAQAQKTPIGRIQMFQNAIKTMQETLGEELIPLQAELADAWRAALPELRPLLVVTLKLLLKVLTKLGNVVRTQLLPWWREFQKTDRFQKLQKLLKWIEDHIRPIALAVGVLVAALVGLNVLTSLVGVITALTSPIGLVILAVAALAAAILAIYYNWDKIKEMFPTTAAIIEHFIEGFKLSFQTGFDAVIAIWKTVVALFTGDWQGVGEAWKKVWEDMKALAEWWKTSLVAIAKEVGKAFKDYFLSVFEDIKTIWTWMKSFSWEGIKKSFAGVGIPEDIQTGGDPYAAGVAANAAAVAPVGSAAAAAAHALPPDALAKVQAERADIVKELQRPELRNLVSATLATEASTAEGQKDVLEAMVNRGVALKRAGQYGGVENMIKGGFYGPYNRGETAAVMGKGLSEPRSQQVLGMINEIGAGRNALRGMTDQGMINEIKGYKENIGGEYFGFMEGLGEQFKSAAYTLSRNPAVEPAKAATQAAAPVVAAAPPYLRGYQKGGIATTPQIATLAEKGPEVVAPLSYLDKLMSMKPALRDAATINVPSMPTQHINFTPNITINGDATPEAQDAMNASLKDLAREFVANFKRAQGHERRLSYESGYG